MDDKIRYWFQGFEQGVAALGTSQQEALFHECGKNCVQQGTLEFYQSLYRTAEGNLDRFFASVNGTPSLRGEVLVPDKAYSLAFAQCSCPLVTEGYVRSPRLCECSRQSVLYVLRTLWPEKRFEVTLCGTILRGAKECACRITVK